MTFNISLMLHETAKEQPEKTCLVFGTRSWSYQEVDQAADLVAANLQGLGLPPGTKIGVQLPNLPQFLFAYFGLVRAGYIMVPLNPLCSVREVKFMLENADCEVMITADAVAGEALKAAQQVGEIPVYVVQTGSTERPEGTRDFTELLAPQPAADMASTQADDTSIIVFTSGTTGTPKGAELSHFGIYMNSTVAAERMGLGPNDKTLAMLPFFHVYGLTSVLNVSVNNGATMILLPRFDPLAALDLIEEHRVVRFSAVPSMLIAMIDAGTSGRDLSSVERVTSGGSALPGEALRRFEAAFPEATVIEGYGLSESTSSVSVNISREERKILSIGKPLWGTECRVVGPDGEALPRGQDHVGELTFRGPTIMKGYYKNPQATEEALREGWLYTGDMGYMDEDGFLFVVDRKKELIIRNGYNVYPREVEEVIATHPEIIEVAVVGKPDRQHGQEIVAVVSVREGAAVTPEEITAHAKESLAAYKYPREVHIRRSLPKSATGKVRKREITKDLAAGTVRQG
ncbi:long-chain-fatty-acid--CoA ligase [Nesterenkonia populi]|uniref:long-chain-fatty-acid--CoA ligase n=1 Tax=Nesterenkonia populi TaxID=1591087 RepID=UPI0011BE0E9F|nr:long-chain fatty acid--CoA ligase [Nesterenkonia populi]